MPATPHRNNMRAAIGAEALRELYVLQQLTHQDSTAVQPLTKYSTSPPRGHRSSGTTTGPEGVGLWFRGPSPRVDERARLCRRVDRYGRQPFIERPWIVSDVEGYRYWRQFVICWNWRVRFVPTAVVGVLHIAS